MHKIQLWFVQSFTSDIKNIYSNLVAREDGWLELLDVKCRHHNLCQCLVQPYASYLFHNYQMEILTIDILVLRELSGLVKKSLPGAESCWIHNLILEKIFKIFLCVCVIFNFMASNSFIACGILNRGMIGGLLSWKSMQSM